MPYSPIFSTDYKEATAPVGVLVIDDQMAVREGLRRLIACAPLTLRYVITAADSAEAQRIANQWHPDVVLLDVDLAGEDGLSLIAKFAHTAGVLVLTSHGGPATRARAAQLGAHAFIEKHQPAADLLNAITDLCRRSTQSREKTPSEPGTSTPLAMAPSSDAIQARNS